MDHSSSVRHCNLYFCFGQMFRNKIANLMALGCVHCPILLFRLPIANANNNRFNRSASARAPLHFQCQLQGPKRIFVFTTFECSSGQHMRTNRLVYFADSIVIVVYSAFGR